MSAVKARGWASSSWTPEPPIARGAFLLSLQLLIRSEFGMSPAQQPADFSQKTLIPCSLVPTLSTAPTEQGLTARLEASSQPVSSYLGILHLRNHLAFPFSVGRTEKYFSAWGNASLWKVLLLVYEAVANWSFKWPCCKMGMAYKDLWL